MCRLARGDSHLRAAVTVVAVVTVAAAIARPVLHAAEIALHIALVTAAAAALRVSRPALSSLLNGKAGLSGEMALRIE